jgi:hypothetical protein
MYGPPEEQEEANNLYDTEHQGASGTITQGLSDGAVPHHDGGDDEHPDGASQPALAPAQGRVAEGSLVDHFYRSGHGDGPGEGQQ